MCLGNLWVAENEIKYIKYHYDLEEPERKWTLLH